MILGITGGFGCGKSSVLRFFSSRDWFTADADALCREFYENKDEKLFECIRQEFGTAVFCENNCIDRKKLAAELFSDSEKMKKITDVIYPVLKEKVSSQIKKCRAENINAAFEIPLLYEAGFDKFFDAVLTVWTPENVSKKRLEKRGFSAEEADRRNKMQMSVDKKLENADFVIINSGSENLMTEQLILLEKKLFDNF